MSALQLYRDDGPLAAWIAGRAAAARGPRTGTHPLAWLVPPLLRLVEYGSLIALTAAADPDALPVCFALLGVLAFHHYDTVYRLRHQRLAPREQVALEGCAPVLWMTRSPRERLLSAMRHATTLDTTL